MSKGRGSARPCGYCKGYGHWFESLPGPFVSIYSNDMRMITCGVCKGTGKVQGESAK